MKFICTRELGRLSKWLRILGYDTIYFTKENMGTLIVEALKDKRIILTRRRKMPIGRGVKIISINSEEIQGQLLQVLRELKIKPEEELMFSRCILCNELLKPVAKEKIRDKVPEYVYQTQRDFIACPVCKRIYWQGTHWGNVQKTLEGIR